MTMVTLRLPDDSCQRLKQLAAYRGISLNKLMEELGTAATAAHDAEVRFRTMSAHADLQRALAVLDRLDEAESQEAGKPKTSARALYQVVAQAVRMVDEYMASEGKGIFYVPELSLVFSVWQEIVRHKGELFGDRVLDSRWQSVRGRAKLIDMELTADDETMLFEFKVKSRSSNYTKDLEKLALPPKKPAARRFFCAMVDEFLNDAGSAERIGKVLKWQNSEYLVQPAVPVKDFVTLPKRKAPGYTREVYCLVTLWELIAK